MLMLCLLWLWNMILLLVIRVGVFSSWFILYVRVVLLYLDFLVSLRILLWWSVREMLCMVFIGGFILYLIDMFCVVSIVLFMW